MTQQHGNALWIILIAIALIGTLTAMFTRSSGTSDDTGDYEKKSILISQMLREAKTMELAVQQLLQRGCGENTISFWTDIDGNGVEDAADRHYNANSPTDHSCHVFDPAGAGLVYSVPNAGLLDSSQQAGANYGTYNYTSGINIQDVGTGNTELIYQIPWLKRDICIAANNTLGVTNPSGEPPVDGNTGNNTFVGAYGAPQVDGIGNDAGGVLIGKRTFCRVNASGAYQFMHVLHAR